MDMLLLKNMTLGGGAASYCSKYILKGGEVDYFIAPEQRYLLSDTSPMLGTQFVN